MNVVIADDHPLVRAGVRMTLQGIDDLTVVAEVADGDHALAAVIAHRPDLLILDISMPGLASDQVVIQGRQAFPELKTLILTAHDDDVYIRRLSQVPISGYLLKDEAPESLAQAVRVIQLGAVWFSKSIATKIMGFSRSKQEISPLFSIREREVLDRIALGFDNQIIAEQLSLAPQTVRNYVSTIYQKIGVDSRVQAMVWAQEHGMH